MDKKRHHYVPKAYLKSFCDAQGRINVYLKDDLSKAIHQAPDNTGFHKYYYSQSLPGGGMDNNTLEDLFSELETKWPPLIDRMVRRDSLNSSLDDLFAFIGLQRARTPASRDASEAALVTSLIATAKLLDSLGRLPPKPPGLENILDHLEVAIDPHQSIHAMVHVIRATGQVLGQIGIGVIHNLTDVPFLTSDNPVIWFNPSVSERELQPYTLEPDGPIVFLFPVTPNVLVYGESGMREQFAKAGMLSSDTNDRKFVKQINRHICRFAYKAVFSSRRGQEPVIREYADVSPVLLSETQTLDGGVAIRSHYVFGKREQKARWANEGRAGNTHKSKNMRKRT
jgi:hypothetical protein